MGGVTIKDQGFGETLRAPGAVSADRPHDGAAVNVPIILTLYLDIYGNSF